jgi:hypothetical protein
MEKGIMATETNRRGLSVGPERAALIRGRLEEIAVALRIPRPAVDGAMVSDAKLLRFVEATGQSLDWVVFGRAECMIRRLATDGRA